MFDFNTDIKNIHPDDFKWDKKIIKANCGNPDAIPCWIADMDYPISPIILEDLRKYISNRTLRYTRPSDLENAYKAYIEKKFNAKDLFISSASGVLPSIAAILQYLKPKRRTLIIPAPTYKPFIRLADAGGYKKIFWPMRYENKYFSLDLNDFEKIASENKDSVLMFCSPHNPSGRVFSKEKLMAISKICKKNNIFVISDEIHADITLYNKEHTLFSLVAKEDNVGCFTLTSPCKVFNMPSEHISFILSSDYDLLMDFKKSLGFFCSSPSLLSSALAIAYYNKGIEFTRDLTRHLEKQIQIMEPLPLIKPEASFITLIDLREFYPKMIEDSKKDESYYRDLKASEGGITSYYLGKHAGVYLHDGSWFGDDYNGFARVNYAIPNKETKVMVERLSKAIKDLI